MLWQSVFFILAFVPAGWTQGLAASPGSQSTVPGTPEQKRLPDSGNGGWSRKLSIGPGDELDVSVYGVPDLSQHARVGVSGDVHLLLIGPVRVAGLSTEEAQGVIEKQLIAGRFIKDPRVSVYVKEFTTQSVSVVGEVNKPGNYPALTTRRLYDAFEEAGGLAPTAGKVSISHSGQLNNPMIVTPSNDPIKSAQANIEIMPGDTITVSKAPIVYVMGEVTRPGGYVLPDDSAVEDSPRRLTVMRVIALASGPVHGAALNKSRIIRRTTAGLQELPIPLKQIMAGKSPDPPLQAEDILYVPGGRSGSYLNSVLTTLTTAAIYRF